MILFFKMNYLLSVVLLLVKIVFCESGAQPLTEMPKNTTTATTQVLSNSTLKTDTTVYFKPQRTLAIEDLTSILNSSILNTPNKNINVTLLTKETVQDFIKSDGNISVTLPTRETVQDFLKPDGNISVTLSTTETVQDFIKPEKNNIKDNNTNSLAQQSIDLNILKDKDTKIKTVKHKNKGTKSSSYNAMNDMESDISDSIISLEKKDPGQQKTTIKTNHYQDKFMKYFLPSSKIKPNKHHIKAKNHNDAPKFPNNKKGRTNIEKTRRTIANGWPIFAQGYTNKFVSDMWNVVTETSKNTHSELNTQYRPFTNKDDVGEVKKLKMRRSDKEGSEYVELLENQYAKYLSKMTKVKNSQNSIEPIDLPIIKEANELMKNNNNDLQLKSKKRFVIQKVNSKENPLNSGFDFDYNENITNVRDNPISNILNQAQINRKNTTNSNDTILYEIVSYYYEYA